MVSAKRLLLLAFFALAACAREPEPEPLCCGPHEPPKHVQDQIAVFSSADHRTILPTLAAYDLGRQCSRISPGPIESTWLPSDEDVEAVETPLNVLLTERLAKAGSDAAPGDYYRQYAGLVIGGRRVIYVNGVHARAVEPEADPARPSNDWRTRVVRICDGGPITFGVEFDPTTGQFANFAFNGSI